MSLSNARCRARGLLVFSNETSRLTCLSAGGLAGYNHNTPTNFPPLYEIVCNKYVRFTNTSAVNHREKPKWRFVFGGSPQLSSRETKSSDGLDNQKKRTKGDDGVKAARMEVATSASTQRPPIDAFNATQTVSRRLEDAARYMKLKHDSISTRKGLWQTQNESDWSVDWRIPLDILKLEFERGQYVHSCHISNGRSSSNEPAKPLWFRRTAVQLSTSPSLAELDGPSEMSKESFLQFIQQIVSLQVPRPLQRNIYGQASIMESCPNQSHQVHIQEKLLAIFQEHKYRPLFSTEAFETAFRFLTRHSMLDSTRSLLNTMVESRIELRSVTFNILLRSAAVQNDLRFFTYFLRLKGALKIPSDAYTWGAFLRTVYSKQVKVGIIREMQAIGVMDDPVAVQQSVDGMVGLDLRSLAKAGQPLESLVTRYDARFGKNWLTLHNGNAICSQLAALGHADQIPQLLGLMKDRGSPPTARTLSVLLHLLQHTKDTKRAIALVELFQKEYDVRCQPQHWPILFHLAWSAHSFNLCRILWILSCHFGIVSPRMREIVYKSLIRNTPRDPQTTAARWAKEAGKVITFSRPIGKRIKPFLGYHTPRNGWIVGWADRHSYKRQEQISLAKAIIRRDLLACRRPPSRTTWLPVFTAAFNRDKLWASWNVLSARPLMWKQLFVLKLGGSNAIRSTRFKRVFAPTTGMPLKLSYPLPQQRSMARRSRIEKSKAFNKANKVP